jgi:hypothetical protein
LAACRLSGGRAGFNYRAKTTHGEASSSAGRAEGDVRVANLDLDDAANLWQPSGSAGTAVVDLYPLSGPDPAGWQGL